MKTTMKPDYEIAREEMESLYAKHLPKGKVVRVGLATDTEDGRKWEHTLWDVIIGGEVFTYKTGTGIKKAPTAAEVFACYCREGMDADTTFAEWCGNFGYNEDSRKAEAIYFACQESGKKALRVIKDRKLMAQFAELSGRL